VQEHSRESSWEGGTSWTSYLKDMQPVVFTEDQEHFVCADEL
jgi:hypothetical protein